MKNIAVIGSGSWGMALSIHMANNGNIVKVWSFSKLECDMINNERKCKFLQDVVIPDNITCTLDIEEAIDNADIIFHVTPSKFARDVFKSYKDKVGNRPVIICSKGFEKESLSTLDKAFLDEKEDVKLGVLSGPSHAEEVSKEMTTLLVIASQDTKIINDVTSILMNDIIRIYTSKDLKGVELGGALKNIIAFAAGIADGIGLGDNAFAALITRGLDEIARLGIVLGGQAETFYGLSGLGDLVVTCLSEHSRNRRAGKLVGQGKTIEQAKQEVGMVIEALDNIDVAYELAKKYNIECPIISSIYDILYNGANPKQQITELMNRKQKSEI